jgi:molybdopterin synthase catalytic subunit
MIAEIRIGECDFDAGAETEALARRCEGPGAVTTFVGYVRAEPGLTSLTLEHYPAMSEREMSRHVEEAARRWALLGVTVIHRVGRLNPGDRIVFVAVAAMHRREAFEACEFVMDYLKTRAPFWKREERDGAVVWVEALNRDFDAANRWRR